MKSTANYLDTQNLAIRVEHSQVILGFILLLFLADGANSLLESIGAPFYRISIIFRSIALVYFLWIVLPSNLGRRLGKIILLFYAIFSIGTFSALGMFTEYNFPENFSLVNKFLFFFICWVTFTTIFKRKKDREQLFKVFELIIWIEVITVLLGFILEIDVLSSYGNRRFGYKGLIPAQNEVSGFFLIAFFYYLAKVNYLGKDLLKLIVVTIAGLITGTKVMLALPLVLTLQMFYWLSRSKVNAKYVYIGIALALLLGAAAFYWESILVRLAPTLNYYAYRIANEDYSPFVIVGSSGRLILIEKFIAEYLPRYNLLNILFGGQDLTSFSTETDVIDVFARFGIIGSLAFYILYLKLLVRDVSRVYIVRFLFAIIWLGVSTVAGHLVFSAINGGYLAILLMAFSTMESYQNSEWKKADVMPASGNEKNQSA